MIIEEALGGHRTAFYYDNRSNLRTVLDPENGLTYYTHDATNRQTSVKNPWAEVTYYEYTPAAVAFAVAVRCWGVVATHAAGVAQEGERAVVGYPLRRSR